MTVRYGRYEVMYKLGQGAMAQVFLARDPVLSRFVAIKVLHAGLAARKDVLQRFFNEARTVAQIRNPQVVELFDFGQEGRDLYQVMEFVDGLSLHSLLRRLAPAPAAAMGDPGGPGSPTYAPMEPVLAAALICQAAEGLAIAARHGVVHRDLKPENLMINTQGRLKISDFGIAHVQDDSLTETGAVLGSPLYMSPEQALGRKPITAQSDMFSLGAVFYACLAGHPPFRARSVTELFRRIASEPHAPLASLHPAIPQVLCGLTDILLRKRPGERGDGAPWLQKELKAFLRTEGVTDAAEPVAACFGRLKAQGIRTTLRMEGAATLPMTAVPEADGEAARLRGDSLSMASGAGKSGARSLAGGFRGPVATAPARAASIYVSRLPGGSDAARRRWISRPLLSAASALFLLALGAGAGALGWKWLEEGRSLGTGADRGRDGLDAAQDSVSESGSLADGVPWSRGARDGSGREKGTAAFGNGVGKSAENGASSGEWPPGNSASAGTGPWGNGGSESPGSGDGPTRTTTGTGAQFASDSGGNPGTDRAPGVTPVTHADWGGNGREGMRPVMTAGRKQAEENVLVLKSSPPFAEAYLDGRYVGVTPVRLSPVSAGRHRLEMKSARAPSLDTMLTVLPGSQALKIFMGASPALRVAAYPGEED